MNPSEPTVFVVDDDQDVRDSLASLFRSVNLPTETYGSAREFLEKCEDARSGCLVVDVRMPGMSGLELLEQLNLKGIALPSIVVTGYGDIPMAIRAMRAGAIDMIEKPFRDQTLLERVQQAISLDSKKRKDWVRKETVRQRMARLTRGEREVMEMVASGLSNKDIAERLGLGCKAIEARRAKVMAKMEADSLAQLVRMVMLTEESD